MTMQTTAVFQNGSKRIIHTPGLPTLHSLLAGHGAIIPTRSRNIEEALKTAGHGITHLEPDHVVTPSITRDKLLWGRFILNVEGRRFCATGVVCTQFMPAWNICEIDGLSVMSGVRSPIGVTRIMTPEVYADIELAILSAIVDGDGIPKEPVVLE